MSETTIFLILDAFRHDYVTEEHTPALAAMADDGTYGEQLKSTSGFTQRSGIFTGTYPDVHGSYTMFTYEPESSPYALLRPLAKISDIIEFHDDVDSAVRRFIAQPLIDRYSDANNAPVARIPYDILPSMSVSEGIDAIYEDGALGAESVFDVIRDKEISFNYAVYPDVTSDEELTTYLVEEMEKGAPDDFYLGQFIASDRDVHKAGVDSNERMQIIQEIDGQIERIRRACEANLDSYNFCVIGDHGMMEVDTYLDLYSKVTNHASKAGLSLGKDYLLFLDSTLARFWFFNDESERVLTEFTHEFLSNHGTIIDESMAADRRIPTERRYGDLLWEADPGTLIYPDYFHETEKYNAMHGYDSAIDQMKGFAVVTGPDVPNRTLDEVELIDICPTLSSLLDVDPPNKNEGESVMIA
jgi:predicted AlkP superfamily pyrophosphatase or phosphodiesterase